jgi:hypothetical protein
MPKLLGCSSRTKGSRGPETAASSPVRGGVCGLAAAGWRRRANTGACQNGDYGGGGRGRARRGSGPPPPATRTPPCTRDSPHKPQRRHTPATPAKYPIKRNEPPHHYPSHYPRRCCGQTVKTKKPNNRRRRAVGARVGLAGRGRPGCRLVAAGGCWGGVGAPGWGGGRGCARVGGGRRWGVFGGVRGGGWWAGRRGSGAVGCSGPAPKPHRNNLGREAVPTCRVGWTRQLAAGCWGAVLFLDLLLGWSALAPCRFGQQPGCRTCNDQPRTHVRRRRRGARDGETWPPAGVRAAALPPPPDGPCAELIMR